MRVELVKALLVRLLARGDASHALDYVDGADTGEEVNLSLCLYCCSPKLRIIFFVGAGDQC